MAGIWKGSSLSWTAGRSGGGYCKRNTLGYQCRWYELAEEDGGWYGRGGWDRVVQ